MHFFSHLISSSFFYTLLLFLSFSMTEKCTQHSKDLTIYILFIINISGYKYRIGFTVQHQYTTYYSHVNHKHCINVLSQRKKQQQMTIYWILLLDSLIYKICVHCTQIFFILRSAFPIIIYMKTNKK